MSPTSEQTPPAAAPMPSAAGPASGPDTPATGVLRMTGAVPTTRAELFGPQGRRAALVSAYPELEEACAALGFGDGLTLGEWSTSPGWALVALARAARPPQPAAQRDWSMATIPELIADIVATHHVPLRHELERLGILIDRLAVVHPHAVAGALRKVYHDFMDGLGLHLDQEESDLFPLCIELEESLSGRRAWEDRDVTSLIRFTGHGHEECESGLRRTMDLLRAAEACIHDSDLALIGEGLQALARDLVVHTAKEGEFLIPAAIFSEDRLRARRHAGHRTSAD